MQPPVPYAALDIDDVKVVVVFVDGRPAPERVAVFEESARRARLEGNVVAVWADEFGRTRFLAPPEQHTFFQVVGYDQLRAQISGQLN